MLRRAVLLLILATLLAGCAANDPMQDPRPVEVVQSFVAAFEARDASAMLGLVEPTLWRREMVPEVRSYLAFLEQVDVSEDSYELLSNTGELAQVRMQGHLEYALRNQAQGEQDLDIVFELVRLEGQWYLQGFSLPAVSQSTPTP